MTVKILKEKLNGCIEEIIAKNDNKQHKIQRLVGVGKTIYIIFKYVYNSYILLTFSPTREGDDAR